MVLVVLGGFLLMIEIVAKPLLPVRLKKHPQDHHNHQAIWFAWTILLELFLGGGARIKCRSYSSLKFRLCLETFVCKIILELFLGGSLIKCRDYRSFPEL